MASHLRAEKSGLAYDVQQKLLQKFDGKEAARTLQWIRLISSPEDTLPQYITKAVERIPVHIQDVTMDEYADYLSSGHVFGYLMVCLDPSTIKDICMNKTWQESNNPAFEDCRKRERMDVFLKFATKLGVSPVSLFQTEQLYEKTNLPQVVVCLSQFGTEAQSKPDFRGPDNFWVQKHKENKRSFTEEQLRSGSAVIGLQAGYTKGANASGITFGGRRHINDTF